MMIKYTPSLSKCLKIHTTIKSIMTENKTYRKIMVDPDQFGSKCFDTATKIVSVPVPEAAGNREVIVRLTTAGVQARYELRCSC